MLVLVLFQAGCYSLLPAQSQLPTQTRELRVTLNERGRVELGAALGPLVDFVDGVVTEVDSTHVKMNVTRVTYIRGGSAIWSGESVAVPRAGVEVFRGRQFSKTRSWLLAGAVVGGIVLFTSLLGLDLFGYQQDDRCTGPSCNPDPAIKW